MQASRRQYHSRWRSAAALVGFLAATVAFAGSEVFAQAAPQQGTQGARPAQRPTRDVPQGIGSFRLGMTETDVLAVDPSVRGWERLSFGASGQYAFQYHGGSATIDGETWTMALRFNRAGLLADTSYHRMTRDSAGVCLAGTHQVARQVAGRWGQLDGPPQERNHEFGARSLTAVKNYSDRHIQIHVYSSLGAGDAGDTRCYHSISYVLGRYQLGSGL